MEQRCFSITLITVFTHTVFYSEKKFTHLLISGRFYFQSSGFLGHPSQKKKQKQKHRNKKQGPGSPTEKVAFRGGPLEMSWGPDRVGCRAAGSKWQRQRQNGICWETEAMA